MASKVADSVKTAISAFSRDFRFSQLFGRGNFSAAKSADGGFRRRGTGDFVRGKGGAAPPDWAGRGGMTADGRKFFRPRRRRGRRTGGNFVRRRARTVPAGTETGTRSAKAASLRRRRFRLQVRFHLPDGLGETRVTLHLHFHLTRRVQDGGMVAASEQLPDFLL